MIIRELIIYFLVCLQSVPNKANLITDDKTVFVDNFNNDQRFNINDCIPLAFGDFNADKIVDIFCRNTQADTLKIFINDDRSTKSTEIDRVRIDGIIHDVLAADFDGDSKLDLFLLYKLVESQDEYNGGFLWGNRSKLSSLEPIDYVFQSTPTIVELNGDSYVDILGMIGTSRSTYRPGYLSMQNRSMPLFFTLPQTDPFWLKSTQATVDLDHDLSADLFLTLNIAGYLKFRLYRLPVTKLMLINEYDSPVNAALYHLSTFADIDADGQLEHLLPVCLDAKCIESRIFVRDDDQWFLLPINFGEGMRFASGDVLHEPFNEVPLSIKIADYDLDGFPDIAVLMKNSKTGATIPMLLRNQECNDHSNNMSCSYNRKFVPQMDEISLLKATDTSLLAFFDILENGYPDILIVHGNSSANFSLTGFQNSLFQDVHFIKVMVLSSFSCETCSSQRKLPYGNNQPGQSIKMETVSTGDGIKDYWVQLAAVQMSQAGQMTLELPYVIIGLGATPNFVERLTITLPPNNESNELSRVYTQMIPNSQVVIIPLPLINPDKWESKLFITPSRMILHTGIALGVTLVLLAAVMAVLQYKEKTEDVRERKEQSQSFHFDAL